MAYIPKTNITNGNTIQASDITNIIDSLNGTGSYEISTTGSFTGSFTGDGGGLTNLGAISSKWSGSNPITREGDVEVSGSFKVSGSTYSRGDVYIGAGTYPTLIQSTDALNQLYWYPTSITVGANRNVLLGNNDVGTPNLSGGKNTILGSFTNLSLTSGQSNIFVGNYSSISITTGTRNIGIGSGFNANVNYYLGINAVLDSNDSNTAVFGNPNYGGYDTWYFGAGKTYPSIGYGTKSINWYVTSVSESNLNNNSNTDIWRFNAGRATGNGSNGSIKFAVARSGSSGTTWNPYVDVLNIYGNTGHVGISGSLVMTGSVIISQTQSAIPTWSGSDGELIPATVSGTHYLYMWMNGAWRSSSFA